MWRGQLECCLDSKAMVTCSSEDDSRSKTFLHLLQPAIASLNFGFGDFASLCTWRRLDLPLQASPTPTLFATFLAKCRN